MDAGEVLPPAKDIKGRGRFIGGRVGASDGGDSVAVFSREGVGEEGRFREWEQEDCGGRRRWGRDEVGQRIHSF